MAVPRHTAAAGQGGDIQLAGVEATAGGEAESATAVRDVPGGGTQAGCEAWICQECNVCSSHRAD